MQTACSPPASSDFRGLCEGRRVNSVSTTPRARETAPSGGSEGDDRPRLPACRSDSCGHTISRLDRLISSKGDYFPLSAFPHISHSFSAAAPRCSDFILPKSYQQACCNMDKANTCYSVGSSYCDCCVSGISPSFQLDARRLSAACCYVISERRRAVWGTLIITQSKV